LRITKYQDRYFIQDLINDKHGIIINEKTPDQFKINDDFGYKSYSYSTVTLPTIIAKALEWMEIVKKDWFKANIELNATLPLKYRSGTINNATVREVCKDFFNLKESLGPKIANQFIEIVENNDTRKKDVLKTMSANTYFEYCKIAYTAVVKIIDKKLSGKALYKRYADNRHEGLLDIRG
jgi:hypothetical protein